MTFQIRELEKTYENHTKSKRGPKSQAQACIIRVEFLPSQLHHWISWSGTTPPCGILIGRARGAFVCLENYPAVTVRVRRPPTRPPSHLPVAPDLKERGLGEVSACARAIVGWPPPHAHGKFAFILTQLHFITLKFYIRH